MKLDHLGRPVCLGTGPARPCGAPVHPGYWLCPTCKRPYTREQLDAALEHPQNAAFKRLMKP